jgi:oligoendopeptidase F
MAHAPHRSTATPDPAPLSATTVDETTAPARSRVRDEIDSRYRWDLAPIYRDWQSWEGACAELSAMVDQLARLQGTLSQGPPALLAALRLQDDLGQLAHRVWYYPSLTYDEDQRDNAANARRQRVQVLFARWEQASAWFKPELLALPLDTVRAWMDADAAGDPNGGLTLYRFKNEDL